MWINCKKQLFIQLKICFPFAMSHNQSQDIEYLMTQQIYRCFLIDFRFRKMFLFWVNSFPEFWFLVFQLTCWNGMGIQWQINIMRHQCKKILKNFYVDYLKKLGSIGWPCLAIDKIHFQARFVLLINVIFPLNISVSDKRIPWLIKNTTHII